MVSYLQTYVLKISLTELILWSIRLNFVTKNYLWTKIEPKRKYKWLQAKRSEGAEGVLAEPRQAQSPTTQKIPKNGRRDLGQKPTFPPLYPKSVAYTYMHIEEKSFLAHHKQCLHLPVTSILLFHLYNFSFKSLFQLSLCT